MTHIVDVDGEPRHVEQFRNRYARVYLATIEPGTCTLYHRHRVDTLYVVLAGGLCRSDEPGHQRRRTGVGRSTGVAAKLAMALRRKLAVPLRLPTGTLLMQYHTEFPLTHRLCAAAGNRYPVRMLGIELRPGAGRPAPLPALLPGLPVEYRDGLATTYRIRLAPGQRTGALRTGRPGLLVEVGGAGTVRWLDAGDDGALANTSPTTVDALLVTLNR
jgi:hypothetical protein